MAVGSLTQPPLTRPQPSSYYALRTTLRNAILLRIFVAILLHTSVPEQLFAPDQDTYHYVGNAFARYWSGEDLFPPAPQGPPAYYYLVGILYYLIGASSLLPKLVNCVVGGLSVPIVHDLARR